MARVLLRNVTKRYQDGGAAALHDITLEARDGEFLVLVGPSGCGKSTILRTIAGLENADDGEVWIGDRRVEDVPPRDRDIAMVFQSYALYPHMRVRDNIGFGLRVRGTPRDEVDRRVRDAAANLGIEALLDKHPRELSGGERQRVALGRAIVRNPQVFLFDEPLSNLDAKLRVQMRAEISGLHRRLGITTVYVTHDQVEAMTMGERIAVLRAGVVQQVAEPLVLYGQPANRFVAGFIGSPPMNFLEARREGGGGGTSAAGGGGDAGAGGTYLLASGARVALGAAAGGREAITLGVRPEEVRIARDGAESGRESDATGAAPRAGVISIRGAIELVERTGAESFLYVTTPEGALVVKHAGAAAPPAGSPIRLEIPTERLHLFDPTTEARIDT